MTDKFIQVAAEKSSPTIHLGAEILQVEFLAHHDLSLTNNRRVVCRTDKNLQLITIGENLDVKCEMWNENMKLATLCQNPYLNGELAFLDASSQIFISSLDTTFSLTSATKLSLSQDSNDQKNFFHRLCWSDHPRQIFALKNNYLNLIDLRDRNCGQFWVQNASKIHTIERFDDDSKYYLLTNDRSAFIIDQRQTGRSVFDFHHNFIDQPTFTAVSDSLQKNSQLDLHRLLILCSRQLNDVFWTPLIWCRKSMTICQGLAPQFVPSLSDNVEWFKCSRPLTTCTTSFQKRCQAPVRGLKLISNALNRENSRCDIALILNDVGDLGYMTFQLGEGNALTLSNSPMYKKELDTIGDFIRSRSSIYIKNNVPEKPAEFLNAENNCDRSTLLDSMTNLSVADDLQISSNFDSSALSQQDLFEKHDVESVIASNIKSDDDDAETAFEEHIFLCDLKSQISSDLNNLIGKNVDDNGKIVLELWNSNDE
uniref:Uncharacterized protein n=1 Tax=Romanomermis culicivorax TaxID=13658 RepID=A0A915HDF6_ROMCU